jgi:hypothetical protein
MTWQRNLIRRMSYALLSIHCSTGWSKLAMDKILSGLAHRVIFVNTSAGFYSLRTNPIVSTSARSYACLTTHESIISRFSAFAVAYVITSKRDRLSVRITIRTLCFMILSMSCFNAYAMSKSSASANVSLPSTDLVTRRDLCDDQNRGWHVPFPSTKKII